MLEKVKGPKLKAADETVESRAPEVSSSQSETEVAKPENVSSSDLPDLGEQYEVLQRIGTGGMGAVYKVRDKSIDSIVAIKVLQQSLVQDAAALKRFQQEAESASHLNHPNLVSVFGHGTTDDGSPYIVMDYLDGKSLADILTEATVLDSTRALKLFSDIAEALAYAHTNGVVHRDVKPTNIIVTNVGEASERAHIVDFGIAKMMPTANRETHDLTQTGEVFGSPNYMSPEQCLGFMLDNRSDIYSLGCLMYEVLTGAPPFDGANPIQVIVKHMNEQPPEFPKNVRTDKAIEKLENVVLRCLDKEKTERYQSAADLLQDFQAISQGKTVAKYSRVAAAKPMFTKRQTIGALVVFTGLTIYGTITAMLFNNEIGQRVIGGLISAVCLAGVYVFYSSAWEIYKKRVKGLTENSAWQIAFLIFLGTGSLTAIQYPALILIGHSFWPLGDFGQNLFFATSCIHLISLAGSALFGICWLLFRKPNRLNVPAMVGKFLVVTILVTGFCRFGIPVQSAKVLSMLASASSQSQPYLAKILYEQSIQLDDNVGDNYIRLSEVNHRLNLHDAEIENYMKALETRPFESWRLSSVAETLNAHKRFAEAKIWYDRAVNESRSRDNGTLQQNLYDRGRFLKEQGDFAKAYRDVSEALKMATYPQEDYVKTLAQICCGLGKYQEASGLLEKYLNMTQSHAVDERILLGIVYDNLGNTVKSKEMFESAANLQTLDAYNVPLYYAYKQLNRNTGSMRMRDSDKSQLLPNLGVPAGSLRTNW